MVTYLQSLQQSLRKLLATDERVYILGEDLLDPYGGAFKVTQGLSTDFPTRVLTTPISEATIIGLGNGMALRGLRPIVEIMFGDFMTLTADQIINYAAKFRPMYNGQVSVPLVIRVPMGGGRGYDPTHSQTLEKIFLGIPHLHLVAPSHFHNPGTMLEHATLADETPVIFIEHKRLYSEKLVTQPTEFLRVETQYDSASYATKIVRNYNLGSPDVTIVGYGGTSLLIAPLLQKLAEEEIRVLACFPGCLKPLPKDLLATCAAESGRVVVVEESTRSFSWGSEVAALLTEHLWGRLQAPIKRVAALDTIIPAAKPLEAAVLPSPEAVEEAIFEVLL
jgi:pyruvate/2-oxoglutarate/acetoin dehydrogenase E1 component